MVRGKACHEAEGCRQSGNAGAAVHVKPLQSGECADAVRRAPTLSHLKR